MNNESEKILLCCLLIDINLFEKKEIFSITAEYFEKNENARLSFINRPCIYSSYLFIRLLHEEWQSFLPQLQPPCFFTLFIANTTARITTANTIIVDIFSIPFQNKLIFYTIDYFLLLLLT